MSNITNLNRDYLIKINVKEATIDVPKMTFWNTDKKTSNMFVQLVINMSTNELISNYVTVQNATDYKITLNVIKPKTNQYKTIEATLLNEEKALFEIDLPDEYKDQVGNYNFEFEVSSKVDGNDESITTSNATYEVKGSILTNLNEETSSSPDLPILKQLIEQVKSLQGGDLTGYQKKSDNSLETTSKEVVGAINEVNSQYKDIAKKVESGNIGNNVEPQLMDMPRIYFSEGTLPTTKTATMMRFDYYSKTTEYHGWAEIKCQGNSSMVYPKKNFTIKLYKDKAKTGKLKIDFKGWGKQSKFVLKANWIDLTHARNVVSARIWGDIVKSRADYSSLPELLRTSPNQGAVDGFPVTVYGNGYYQGRYTLNIPKDKWMSNMDDTLDTHCILCGENYGSGCFRALPVINGSDWTDELHDVVPASIKTSWTNAIKFVMNSTDAEFKTNLGNYFDVNSLIDYLLYGLISTGLDAFGKNQIYMTYDGTKWIASMYDMDSTWGLYYTGGSILPNDYSRKQYEDYKGNDRYGNLLYIRLEKLFINEIKSRYTELEQTIFTYPYLVNKFEEFVQICPNDIIIEDYATTTVNGAYIDIPSTTTNNIQQIRANIKDRLNYIDDYINGLVEPVACTSLSLNKSTIELVNVGATETLIPTKLPSNCTYEISYVSDKPNIANVDNNGVVTAKAIGNCVITATCGDKIAQCQVTVTVQTITVDSISLPATATLFTGNNIQLQATINPSNATNQNVTWSCDNQNVTLNPSGLSCTVTAVSGDSAIITVKTEDGEKVATCNITITNLATTITLDGTENWSKINWPSWVDSDYSAFEYNITNVLPKGTILSENNNKSSYFSIDGFTSDISPHLNSNPNKAMSMFWNMGTSKLQIGIESSLLNDVDVNTFKNYLTNNNLILKFLAIPENLLKTITEFYDGIYNEKGEHIDYSSEKSSDFIELPLGAKKLYTFQTNKDSLVWFYDKNKKFISRINYGNEFSIPLNAKYFITRVLTNTNSLNWFAI